MITVAVLGFFLSPRLVFGQEIKTLRIPLTEQISQYSYSDSNSACGPTCLLMQFQNGTSQMQTAHDKLLGSDSAKRLNFLVDRFLKTKRSTLSPKLYRWSNGVFVKDLEAAAGDWLAENELDRDLLSGMWLDRENGSEKDSEMVRRIHRRIRDSIRAGVPPILSLRSFVARERFNVPGKIQWIQARHHFVLITEVPDSLIRGDETAKIVSSQGFKLGIVDPAGGMASEIFLFHDSNNQPFTALKGNEIKGEWVEGKPFLQVAAPTLGAMKPANLKWSERVVTTANYLIGKF